MKEKAHKQTNNKLKFVNLMFDRCYGEREEHH